jgi:hypothetical protein
LVFLALRETGYLFKDILERRIRGLSKWVCIANHICEKELNNIINIGMEEEINTYHSYMKWVSYTARKKVSSSTPILSSPIEKDTCRLKRPHYLDKAASQSTPVLQTFSPSPPPAPPTTKYSSL